ncbi:30S ribosomal protein S9 [Candidatus Hodgkinia cicadicola]
MVCGEVRASAKKKTAVATARLRLSSGFCFVVNSVPFADYFRSRLCQALILDAFGSIKYSKFSVCSIIHGGGLTSQACALRLAVVKCVLGLNQQMKRAYKHHGLAATDSRVVERKKFGRAKARKLFQFSKR